jgi:hypothetical protein
MHVFVYSSVLVVFDWRTGRVVKKIDCQGEGWDSLQAQALSSTQRFVFRSSSSSSDVVPPFRH